MWQVKLGASYSAPVIYRGHLYHFDRYDDLNRLICRESETGRELWRYEYPTTYEDLLGYNNGPRCTPIVDDDRVYIVGAEGQIHCVSAAAGQLLWKVDTFEKFHVVQNFFGVGSTPVVFGDLLIANIGGSPPNGPANIYVAQGRVRPDGSGVVAFDKRTGVVRYKLADELAGYASPVLAEIEGRAWCFVFARGGLLGFNPSTGELDFHYPWRAKLLESVNASSPVVVGSKVLISECYGPGASLLQVSPGKVEVVWADNPRNRAKALQTHWCTPAYQRGYVYASSGRHTAGAELRCVDWESGKVMWTEPGLQRAAVLLVGEQLLVLSEGGLLRVVKATPEGYEETSRLALTDDNGKPLLKYPAWTAPVVSHGLLYLRGSDRLICLDISPE